MEKIIDVLNEEEFVQFSRQNFPRLLGIYKGKITGKDNIYLGKEVVAIVQNQDLIDFSGNLFLRENNNRNPDSRTLRCFIFEHGKVILSKPAYVSINYRDELNKDYHIDLDLTKNLLPIKNER